jgi:hypothetical protein
LPPEITPTVVIARFMRATQFLFAVETKMDCPDKPGNDDVERNSLGGERIYGARSM